MQSAAGARFSVIPEGDLKEELWEWSEIEAMSRSGRLSAHALVFVPEENAWRRLVDTELAACFERAAPAESPRRDARAGRARDDENDEDEEPLLDKLRSNPNDIALRLKAAEVALAAGRVDAARDHYQRALEASPYHPRVAQEAKRKLPASKRKSLRYLERAPEVWEDPVAVLAYPFSRGPLYIVLPALALALLFWTGWTTALAFVAASLWMMDTARSASLGERRAPLWRAAAADPIGRILKPAAVTLVVAAELSAVFVAIAGVLVLTGVSGEAGVLVVIRKSPVLTVLLCTLFLLYFPAAAMLSGASRLGIFRIANPKTVVSAVRTMEGEYLICVLALAVLLCAVWGVGALVGSVPVVGRAFHAAGTVYIVLFAGFVLGKLYARFGERIDTPAPAADSDAE